MIEKIFLDYTSVLIASLDCNAADSVNKDLCLNFGVGGLPHIQILHLGKKVYVSLRVA